ncbi:NAD+ kinase [Spizellomyces sp. 'palustris']|nr:NAD+ kinase [Spizellomyces sp. 'palustris']
MSAERPDTIELKLFHHNFAKYAFVKDSDLTYDGIINAFENTFTGYDHKRFGIEFFDGSHYVELKGDGNHLRVLRETIKRSENGRKGMLRSVEHQLEFLGMETSSVSTIVEASVRLYEKLSKVHRMRLKLDHLKSIIIVTKPQEPSLVPLTKEVAIWIIYHFCVDVYVGEPFKERAEFGYESLVKDETIRKRLKFWTPDGVKANAENISLVVTLGGDGTVLYTDSLFQNAVPPVMSFHRGSLGFLTNFQINEYPQSLKSVLSGEGHHVNLRQRLSCAVYRWKRPVPQPSTITHCTRHDVVRANGGCKDCEEWPTGDPDFGTQVLNELVLDRGPNPGLLMLELYVDNMYLTTIQADGLVVATSTGSTAYSLSAGGSLVHPDKSAILITPICAHTLTCRPMILPGRMCLRICVSPNSRSTAWASFDARDRMELYKADSVCVTTSRYPFLQICRYDQTKDWCRSLISSLHWNEREHQRPLL